MYEELTRIAREEFGDIVTDSQLFHRRASIPLKLRLKIRDGSYIDIWVNESTKRYAYHWELRATRGLIFRHDNAPDHPEISTFPKHFHKESEENICLSEISDIPHEAIREFLNFVREKLSTFEKG